MLLCYDQKNRFKAHENGRQTHKKYFIRIYWSLRGVRLTFWHFVILTYSQYLIEILYTWNRNRFTLEICAKIRALKRQRLLLETDEWLRRRIRMCIWKSWKNPKTRISNLIRCGIPKRKAREWGYSRQGYWRIADSCITHSSITNERLRIAGYPTLYDEYLKWYPK